MVDYTNFGSHRITLVFESFEIELAFWLCLLGCSLLLTGGRNFGGVDRILYVTYMLQLAYKQQKESIWKVASY